MDLNPQSNVVVDDAKIVDPRAVTDLVLAFENVCKIGVFYPPGHQLCEQAAAFFLRSLARVVGKSPTLVIQLNDGSLEIQGVELDDKQVGVERLRDLLNPLGIVRVDLERDLSTTDLYDFVTRLFAHRSRLRNVNQFEQLDVDDLPAAVRIRHREFQAQRLPDAGEGADGDGSQPSVEILLASLARQGLGEEQLATCRRLLRAIPARLEEWRAAGGVLPQVSWADVEKLLLRVARTDGGALKTRTSARPVTSDGSLDSLAALFQALRNGDTEANSREAIDLLLSLNRRAHQPAAGADTPASKPAAPHTHDVAATLQLQRALTGYSDGPGRHPRPRQHGPARAALHPDAAVPARSEAGGPDADRADAA